MIDDSPDTCLEMATRAMDPPIPEHSTADTDLAGLRGERITDGRRWEQDERELFADAGCGVPREEMRVVAVGTLLAVDPSLEPVMSLIIGTGLWRDATSDWHPWVKKGQTAKAQRHPES